MSTCLWFVNLYGSFACGSDEFLECQIPRFIDMDVLDVENRRAFPHGNGAAFMVDIRGGTFLGQFLILPVVLIGAFAGRGEFVLEHLNVLAVFRKHEIDDGSRADDFFPIADLDGFRF